MRDRNLVDGDDHRRGRRADRRLLAAEEAHAVAAADRRQAWGEILPG